MYQKHPKDGGKWVATKGKVGEYDTRGEALKAEEAKPAPKKKATKKK